MGGLDLCPGDPPRLQFLQELLETLQIELILQAGAPGLQENREISQRQDGIQKLLGLEAAHPQGHPFSPPAPLEKQRPSRAFPEPGPEKSRPLQAHSQQILHPSAFQKRKQLLPPNLVGEQDRQAVVSHVELQAVAVPRLPGSTQGHGQGTVDLPPPKGVQHDHVARSPPGTGAHLFDHQMVPMGKGASGLYSLPSQEINEPFSRLRVHAVDLPQRIREGRVLQASVGFFQKFSDLLRKVKFPAALFALPERGRHSFRWGWKHKDIVVRDLADLPGLRTQGKGIPDRSLPDELFIQFPDPGIALLMTEVEVSPVGDDPPGGIEGPQGPFPGRHRAIQAVHGEAGLQLPDQGVSITAGQHIQHQVECPAAQVTVRVAGLQDGIEGIHLPSFHPRHGDDHLREDVQGTENRLHFLDLVSEDRRNQHRGFEKILGMGGEEGSPTDLADLMAGPPHPLNGGRYGKRRLNQDDFVEITDVDSQFQRMGRHDRFQLPRLELSFHFPADLQGEGPVVGVGQGLLFPLVDLQGQSLGETPAVYEDQCGAVLADDAFQFPDDGVPGLARISAIGDHRGVTKPEVITFWRCGTDDGDRPGEVSGILERALKPKPAHKLGHPLQGTDGGGKGDALELPRQGDQSLHGGDQMDPSFVAYQSMDLIKNHRGKTGEH